MPHLTLFDLDGTLIPIDSDHAFGDFLVAQGWVDGADFKRRNDAFYADYSAGKLDLAAYVDFATSAWRDRPQEALMAMRERFVRECMQPVITPQARELVEHHRAAGDLIALVTATNEFVTRPLADAFGIETLIAVELERDGQGRITGAIRGTPSFQAGKIRRVDDWLASLGHRFGDFERTTFYSDSTNDLPLLERVSHPVATNPGPALERIARERGWPLLKLFA
jgi:HAD superfamily hydrolase (TIGR01490 family)